METNQPLDGNLAEGQINDQGKHFLQSASKWTKFISIFYFIVLGIASIAMLIGMVGMLTVGGIAGIIGVLMMGGILALSFYVTLCLYRFSAAAEKAVATDNSSAYTDALKNLNSFFKITGILLIIMIAFYALAFIIGIGGAAMMGPGGF